MSFSFLKQFLFSVHVSISFKMINFGFVNHFGYKLLGFTQNKTTSLQIWDTRYSLQKFQILGGLQPKNMRKANQFQYLTVKLKAQQPKQPSAFEQTVLVNCGNSFSRLMR